MNTDQLGRVFPKAAPAWLAALADAMPKWDINTPAREAAFLGQLGHESAGLTRLEESLYYSAERMVAVWPSRFQDVADAVPYAKNPEALANKVYADRMGNGPESSGDGWRYRGRGPIQITGRDNYTRFAAMIGHDIVDAPDDVVGLPWVGCAVACAFWKDRGCNELADEGDHGAITRRVNGGSHGLKERLAYVGRAQAVLG